MAVHNNMRFTSSDRIKGKPYIKSGINLCRLPNGLACMGCCGMDFLKEGSTKKDFIAAMIQSGKELKKYDKIMDYKNRVSANDLHKCGQCRQLVIKEDGTADELVKKKHICFTCPLHPAENNGKELRYGECDHEFMCEGQRAFNTWDEAERAEFLKFIESKNLDWFEYSKKMNNNELLDEFLDT